MVSALAKKCRRQILTANPSPATSHLPLLNGAPAHRSGPYRGLQIQYKGHIPGGWPRYDILEKSYTIVQSRRLPEAGIPFSDKCQLKIHLDWSFPKTGPRLLSKFRLFDSGPVFDRLLISALDVAGFCIARSAAPIVLTATVQVIVGSVGRFIANIIVAGKGHTLLDGVCRGFGRIECHRQQIFFSIPTGGSCSGLGGCFFDRAFAHSAIAEHLKGFGLGRG